MIELKANLKIIYIWESRIYILCIYSIIFVLVNSPARCYAVRAKKDRLQVRCWVYRGKWCRRLIRLSMLFMLI